MMCTPLRSPKIYGFILGFQRWVWWPKCAPASSNCCMVTTVVAIVFLLPVLPRRSQSPAFRPAPVCQLRLWDAGHLVEEAASFKGLAGAQDPRLTHENKRG